MKSIKKLSWKNILAILIGLFILVYPFAGANSYIKHLFILFFIWSVVAASWNLLNGYAGIISLGNIGFMAIGGYASGILAKSFGLSPWISIPIGGIITCVLVTLFLGFPALRLSGIYIALLSLIFADSLPSILTQTREITGGAMGLHEIPGFIPHMEKIHAYYFCFVFFLIAMFIVYRTIHSHTGLAFMALRDSENFATTLGVNRFRERLKVFAISSFLTGLAGGFYVHSLGDISPTTLGIEPFLLSIAMFELGGIGTFAGPILGAAVIVFGGEFLRLAGTLRLSLLGLLICLIILFFPGGIMQLISQSETFIRKQIKKRKPVEKVQPT
ncbi:MAG: branched-chain amino acid ABC transporter permease [Anaerolineales bacterium]